MFSKTNIAHQLAQSRAKRIDSSTLLSEIAQVFAENETHRQQIHDNLLEKNNPEENKLQFDKLNANKIFHLSDIQKLCITYRLRFVDAHYFKGEFPEETITAVRALEKEHQAELKNFKLVAPAKLLKLENADDPLLFAPMGNDYFYLVHQWGNDLHPFRKLMMWPLKNLENLAFSIFVFSVLLTFLMPLHLLVDEPGIRERIILFMFVFNWTGGMVLLIGIGKGKNVNEEIWNSKYYNA